MNVTRRPATMWRAAGRFSATERWRTALLVVPALAALTLQQALLTRPFIDDSYIFYRYAANWAGGLGPVFNRAEHVEGFSSSLWTALLALVAWLGPPPEQAAPAIGVALAAVSLLLVIAVGRQLAPARPWIAVLAATGLALSPAWAVYASSGMDTVLFALILLAVVAACARYVESARANASRGQTTLWALGWLALLVVVRAEGPLYAVAIALASAVLAHGTARSRIRAHALALPAGAIGVVAVVLLARQLVYHSWVPATVLAKDYSGHLASEALHGLGGLGRLTDVLRWGAHYVGIAAAACLLLLIAGAAAHRQRGERIPPLVLLGGGVIALSAVTALWAGGDWMPFRRLLIPVLPLMVLLSAWAAAELLPGAGRHREHSTAIGVLLATAGAALALLAVGTDGGSTAPQYEARQLHALGSVLRDSPRPLRLLTNLAGVLPYSAGVRTYVWDSLGLTDIHNARHGEIFSPEFGRTDPAYDFSRRFDLFVSNSAWDYALLLARLPAEPGGWVRIETPGWATIPLYVVARPEPDLLRALQFRPGSSAQLLTAVGRQRQLSALVASGAVPPGLLAAAANGRPFPA